MKWSILLILIVLIIPAVAAINGGGGVSPGAGSSPIIENLWVLPDDSLDNGTQLQIVPGGERNDIYACIVVSDNESRDTISDVFVDLFHPDDSFKYQMHASLLNITTSAAAIEDCLDKGWAADLISVQENDDIYYNIFSQPNWNMYKVYLPMYYHQPAGIYPLKAYAVDSTSRLSVEYNSTFEWVPGTYLELDFTSVKFGDIQPGAWKIVNGDLDMSSSNKPTLKNNGNTQVKVGVLIEEFRGQDNNPNKMIERFDSQLRNMGTNNYLEIPGEHLEFDANELVWFTHPISLCRQEKIDFSIHADIGLVPDNYAGDVFIYADPVIVDSPPPEFEAPQQNQTQYCEGDNCCAVDDDCIEGYYCSIESEADFGYCEEIIEEPACTIEDDCDFGFICTDNECVQDVECFEDLECDEGFICSENVCVEDLECTINEDCASGEVCSAGFCEPEAAPVECVEDLDCAQDEICTENVCEPNTENECQVDEDCEAGFVCDTNMCVEEVA